VEGKTAGELDSYLYDQYKIHTVGINWGKYSWGKDYTECIYQHQKFRSVGRGDYQIRQILNQKSCQDSSFFES
jgi:hypothetical protein